jgi:hypothetical protein
MDAQGQLDGLISVAEGETGARRHASHCISSHTASPAPRRTISLLPRIADEELNSILSAIYTTLTHPSHRADIDDELAARGLRSVHRHHKLDLLQPMTTAQGGPQQPFLEAPTPAVLALGLPAWLRELLERHGLTPAAR